MAHDVFISYAKEDKSVADAVCQALEEGGVRCWYAPRDVPLAIDYEEAIVDAISESSLMVLILSSHSNKSLHVKREVQNAYNEPPISVLPFLVEDISLNKSLRYYIGSVQWLSALTPPLETQLQQLVDYVQARLQDGEALLSAEKEADLCAEEEHQRKEEEKQRAEEERRLAEKAAQRAEDQRRQEEEEERQRKEVEEREKLEAEESARRREEERILAEAAERKRVEQEAERKRVEAGQQCVGEVSWWKRFGAKLWIGLGALVLLIAVIVLAASRGFWSGSNPSSNVSHGIETKTESTPTRETQTGTTKSDPALDIKTFGSPLHSRGRDELYQIALSADGQMLASTGGKKVRLWQVKAPGKSIELANKATDVSEKKWLAVAFSPDGQTLACGNFQGELQIWRLSDNSPINHVAITGVSNIFRVEFSADGQTLLSAGIYGVGQERLPAAIYSDKPKKVHIWRASDLSSLGDMTLEDRKTIIAVDPDRRVIAINDPQNGLQLWSIEKQSFLKQLEGDSEKALSGAFSSDGEMLVLGNNDGTVGLIKVADGSLIKTLTGPEGEIYRVAISRDAKIIAGGWKNGTVQVWRVRDSQPIKLMTGRKESVMSLVFSANNQILASASAHTIRLWQISETKE